MEQKTRTLYGETRCTPFQKVSNNGIIYQHCFHVCTNAGNILWYCTMYKSSNLGIRVCSSRFFECWSQYSMCQCATSVTFHVNNFALVLVSFVLFQAFWTSTIILNGEGFQVSQDCRMGKGIQVMKTLLLKKLCTESS